jgi:hypothetical protein
MMHDKRQVLALFFLPSLALFLWGGTIYKRATVEVSGKVIEAETSCVQPDSNRCVTAYVLEDSSGGRQSYEAASNSHSLPLRLPVGTVIYKKKWKVDYSIDGQRVSDFPMWAYIGGIAAAFFGGWRLYLASGVSPSTSPERAREG